MFLLLFFCFKIKFDTALFPYFSLIFCKSTRKNSCIHFISMYLKNRYFKATYKVFPCKFMQKTVNCRLHCANLCARKPFKRPLLSRRHRQARHHWSRGHNNWSIGLWESGLKSIGLTRADFSYIIFMGACAHSVLQIQHTGNSTSLELQRLMVGVWQFVDIFYSTAKWTFMFWIGIWRVKTIAITFSGISLYHILIIPILQLDRYSWTIMLDYTEHSLFQNICVRR